MSGPPFAKIAWLGAVRRCIGIPAAQRLVVEHIGDTADRNGLGARMSTARVTAELDVSPETVKRARSAATQHGFWVVVSKPRRGRPPAEGGAGRAAEYRLTMPAKSVSTDPISDDNAVSSDPITVDNRVSNDRELGQKPLINGSVETTPSGSSSGPSSVKRAASAEKREPAPAKPQPPDGDAVRGARERESESSDAAPVTANAAAANTDDDDADLFWAEPDAVADVIDAEIVEPLSSQYVAELIAEYPRVVADRLRREVDGLRAEGYADAVIGDALWKWRYRSDAKPGLLPHLVADVVKEHRATADAIRELQAANNAGWTATPDEFPELNQRRRHA